jgi:hypothetical protein
MTESEAVPLRSRALLHMHVDEDAFIGVDHVYLPEGQAGTCDHDECGNPAHDSGMVGLAIMDGEDQASVLLTAEQALVLANRLQRAASLILESEEDLPDMEREAARFGNERTDQS